MKLDAHHATFRKNFNVVSTIKQTKTYDIAAPRKGLAFAIQSKRKIKQVVIKWLGSKLPLNLQVTRCVCQQPVAQSKQNHLDNNAIPLRSDVIIPKQNRTGIYLTPKYCNYNTTDW